MDEKSCGAIPFILQDGKLKFLLVRHNEKSGNHWSFPKGHVEKGETEEETAVREVKEETNLDVGLLDFRETINYKCKVDVCKKVVFFIGYVENPDVKLLHDELQDYKWLDYVSAEKQLTYDNSIELLKKANAYLIKIYS